jgi:ABC-type nitrate/sulfonate/bicarbonate transport system substrate-binding protein
MFLTCYRLAMSGDESPLTLKTVTRTQGANVALKDGSVRPDGFAFDFVEVPVLVQAFRRMVRGLEFDVSEMAFTTYLCARAHGVRFSALPVFLVRGFHHGAIVHNTRLGIRHPKDLEGRRVGVNRGYTVTTGVWARGILADEYGVDLDTITWVLSGDEHVAEYRPPANVVRLEPGRTLEEQVATGELAAAIGVKVDHPDVAPLIPDAGEAAFAAFRTRGLYPINHLVVVTDELLEARPELAGQVFDAFERAKDRYVDRLRAGAVAEPTPAERLHLRVLEATGADPLPYGVGPNRAMIDELIGHAVRQRILPEPPSLETLFPYSTR